jgi:hypothetical protein
MKIAVGDESRREFQEWFRDAAARTVDALMKKIDENVVSYEHVVALGCSRESRAHGR